MDEIFRIDLQEKISISSRHELYPIECEGNDVGGTNRDDNEFQCLDASP